MWLANQYFFDIEQGRPIVTNKIEYILHYGPLVSMQLFSALFNIHYFRTKLFFPTADKLLRFFLYVVFPVPWIIGIFNFDFYLKANELLGIPAIMLIIYLGISGLKKKYKPAKYYVAAQIFFIVGATITILSVDDIIPRNIITFNAIQLGSVLEAIVFFYGLRVVLNEGYIKAIDDKKRLIESSQINTHLFFNALNSIQLYIKKNNPENALEYLSDYSLLLRNYLESTRLEYVTLEHELNFIHSYVKIEERAHGDFMVTIDSGDLPLNLIQIPGLMIQPFVENAIRHGVRKDNLKNKIRATIRKDAQSDFLTVKIEDNGGGLKSAFQEEAHKSVGISLTKDRIHHFGGPKEPIKLENITNNEGEKGLRITLILPYQIINQPEALKHFNMLQHKF